MNYTLFNQKYIKNLGHKIWMILKEFFFICKYYSFKYAFYYALWWISGHLHLGKICMWSFEKKKKFILSFSRKNHGDIIAKYKKLGFSEEVIDPSDYKIWVFWAQGFLNPPELVKACNARLNSVNKGMVVV